MSGQDDELGRGDLEAVLETRRELGARYDAELVEGFADRVERVVESRVAEQLELQHRRTDVVAGAGGRQLALGIISLVALVPISIVLSVNDQLPALVMTLAAIVAVNLAHGWQSRGS